MQNCSHANPYYFLLIFRIDYVIYLSLIYIYLNPNLINVIQTALFIIISYCFADKIKDILQTNSSNDPYSC